MDLARLDAGDGDRHSARRGHGGDARRRRGPGLFLDVDQTDRAAALAGDFPERPCVSPIRAGGGTVLLCARDQTCERAGARVARCPVLSGRDGLAQIALQLEQPILAGGGERVEETPHAAGVAVAPREERDERLESVLSGVGGPGRGIQAPERAKEADARLLQALQALLGDGLGPERLVADHQARVRALRLGHFHRALQRDVQRIGIGEVERAGRPDVERDLVRRQVRQRGLQLADGGA